MANMTAPMIAICLERGDASMPWGFRLQGGADYRLCLSVKKVSYLCFVFLAERSVSIKQRVKKIGWVERL